MTDQFAPPNGRRSFLHKRIAKFAGKLGGIGLDVLGAAGIPGVSGVARFGRTFLRGGSRSRQFTTSRTRQITRGRTERRLIGQIRVPQPVGPGGIIGLLPGVKGGISGFAQEAAGATCPKGFHINRSGYHLRDGTFVAPASRCVRNRRRNNDNGRAAMRAARRLLGRKKSQDAIDKALRAFAPRSRKTSRGGAPPRGTTIVQN